MGSDTEAGPTTDLALLASVLAGRRDEPAEAMTDQIMSQAPVHGAHPAREVLLRTCRTHPDALLRLPPYQRAIMEAELAAYRSAIDAARVASTVTALRAKAAGVVEAELARLSGRLGSEVISDHALEEIACTMRRVADKLLHAPTVRVQELSGSPAGESYAAALQVLFDLDP